MSIEKSLAAIQSGLKAPKDQKTNRYRYRNIEDINEAVKPLAAAEGCAVLYRDSIESIEGLLYCNSICELRSEEGSLTSVGFALINTKPQNMSVEQSCGAASSYARKYAACGLFAIDDSANDPDTTNGGTNASKDKTPPQNGSKAPQSGRFGAIKALKAEALELGISEGGIKAHIDATYGKPLAQFTATDIKTFEIYLTTLIADKRSLMAKGA